MHGINLTADMDARTLIPEDPSAKIGASADEGSDSIAVTFSPALPEGAVADIVYGIIVRMNGTIGHPFSRLDTDGDCVVPSQVLAGCTAGTLPVSVRVTYADGSVGCTPEVVLGVDMVPDPVTEAESKGFPLLMTRDSSWAWEKSWVYQKGSMVTYGDSVYVSTANDNVGNVPDSLVGWKLATESATVWGGITGTLANQRDLADALAGKADASALDALGQTVAGKQDALTFDSAPTAGSVNPVTSGGVYSALDGKVSKSGDTMSGDLYIHKGKPIIALEDSDWPSDGSNPTSNRYVAIGANNKNSVTVGFISFDVYTTGQSRVRNQIKNQSGATAYIETRILPDGSNYSYLSSTPDYNDNSTKIATTAYVMSNPHVIKDFGDYTRSGKFYSNTDGGIGFKLGWEKGKGSGNRGFVWVDNTGDNKGVAYVSKCDYENGSSELRLLNTSYDSSGNITNESRMGLIVTSDTAYGYAPTPDVNSNGNVIATTAWVRARIQEALGQ